MFWYILHFSSLYKFDFVGCIWWELEDCVQIYHYLWEIYFLLITCLFLCENAQIFLPLPRRSHPFIAPLVTWTHNLRVGGGGWLPYEQPLVFLKFLYKKMIDFFP